MITLIIEVDSHYVVDFCGERKQLVPGDKVTVTANSIECMSITPDDINPSDLSF